MENVARSFAFIVKFRTDIRISCHKGRHTTLFPRFRGRLCGNKVEH